MPQLLYFTAQRMAEFGLRVALGARPGEVGRLVLARATGLTVLGIAVGPALALASSRVVATLLFGIATTDLLTYAAVLLTAMPLVLAATAIPAMRAARVNPMLALKAE